METSSWQESGSAPFVAMAVKVHRISLPLQVSSSKFPQMLITGSCTQQQPQWWDPIGEEGTVVET